MALRCCNDDWSPPVALAWSQFRLTHHRRPRLPASAGPLEVAAAMCRGFPDSRRGWRKPYTLGRCNQPPCRPSPPLEGARVGKEPEADSG